MELPGGQNQDVNHVFLRHNDQGIDLVAPDRSVEDVPASAVRRSRLLQSFAGSALSDRRLELPIADVIAWMKVADGTPVEENNIIEVLNVRKFLPEVELQHVFVCTVTRMMQSQVSRSTRNCIG